MPYLEPKKYAAISVNNIAKNRTITSPTLLDSKNAIVIDPSCNNTEIKDCLIKNDLFLKGVLLTHAHFDHCFDTARVLSKWNVPVYLHEADKDTYLRYRYDDLASMQVKDFSKNIKWFNGKVLNIGNFKFNVIHTPGHTKGSVTYKYHDWIFVGDTLFYNSYGRTDLANSNPLEMIKSLNLLWKEFKDNDLILPGHNKWARFNEIKKNNYMVQEIIKK